MSYQSGRRCCLPGPTFPADSRGNNTVACSGESNRTASYGFSETCRHDVEFFIPIGPWCCLVSVVPRMSRLTVSKSWDINTTPLLPMTSSPQSERGCAASWPKTNPWVMLKTISLLNVPWTSTHHGSGCPHRHSPWACQVAYSAPRTSERHRHNACRSQKRGPQCVLGLEACLVFDVVLECRRSRQFAPTAINA